MTRFSEVGNKALRFFAGLSKQFNKLPGELKFSYYMGSTTLLTLLTNDITQLASEANNAYVSGILTFFVINTIQYVIIKFGEYAEALQATE